jgi:hypothetical protein
VDPLRVAGLVRRLLEGPHERSRIACGQRVEQTLVDREVEHHLQAVAFVTEVLDALVRRHVGLGQQDGVAAAPLQEAPHLL